jgi:large subunit ribosomal protein L9
MKVILLEDVTSLGNIGDTVNVKDGYARNYLIPRKKAVPATMRNLKAKEHQLRTVEHRKTQVVEQAKSLGERISGTALTFTRKSGESGHLFGSVTNMDIADALKEKDLIVDRKDIVLPEHIKDLGEFEVSVKLHHDVTPVIRVTVLPEEGEIPEKAMEDVMEEHEHAPEESAPIEESSEEKEQE